MPIFLQNNVPYPGHPGSGDGVPDPPAVQGQQAAAGGGPQAAPRNRALTGLPGRCACLCSILCTIKSVQALRKLSEF